MINKQRVQRIRGFIYTCFLLLFFIPAFIMLFVSVKTWGMLERVSDYLEQAVAASSMWELYADNNPERQQNGGQSDSSLPPESSMSADQSSSLSSQGGGQSDEGQPSASEESSQPEPSPADASGQTASSLPEVSGQSAAPSQGDAGNASFAQSPVPAAAGQADETGGNNPATGNGGYVFNTYRPVSYSHLFFDTMPEPVTSRANTLYLTFENIPATYAGALLDVLEKQDVRATFFVWCNDGAEFSSNAFYRQLAEQGHQIGIHSSGSEKPFSELYSSVDAYLEDFNRTYEGIYRQTGIKPRLYRLPDGSAAPDDSGQRKVLTDIRSELDARGFLQYEWASSPQDAITPSLSKVQIIRNMQNSISDDGQVVIFAKDGTGSRSTAEALDDFISQYKAKGYAFGILENGAEPASFIDQK